MLDFDDAQQRLTIGAPSPTHTEFVPLLRCTGRVLAAPVSALLDLPTADTSAMDGYAIRHADLQPSRALPVQERCYAGEMPRPLIPGHATRLFTGSLMPQGADTVIMQEHTHEELDASVRIDVPPRPGQHVRRRGEDIREGRLLLQTGTFLHPAHAGLIAAQGIDRTRVFSKLRVGILTTGDELVAPGNTRNPQQIFDSNGPMLAALVEGMGAQATCVLHAPDNELALRSAFTRLLSQCDLIISAGGVSVGEKDLVKPVIESLGGVLALWKVRTKPGKPVSVAYVDHKPVVCLPGNPGAAFSVFVLLVTPMMRRMQGRVDLFPPVITLPLHLDSLSHNDRDLFVRVQCQARNGAMELVPNRQQSPGSLSSMACATGLARIPADSRFEKGDCVAYYDFAHWLA